MGVYVVTGGAGFIGSHVVDFLVSRGDKVRVVDNLLTGKMDNLNNSLHKITFVKLDINDHDNLIKVFSGADFVIHLAALPSVPRSMAHPRTSHHHNLNGALSVFEAAKRAGVKKVVYASSSSVYGDSDVLPQHEGMQTKPKSPYALQKLTMEKYAAFYADSSECEYIGLRFFNVFGPRQDPHSPYAAVIPKFIPLAKQGKPIAPVFGDGNQTRDFTYVTNVVNGIALALQSEGNSGKVFNITGGREMVLNDVIDLIGKLVGRKLEVVYVPERKGDILRSFADLTLAKKHLGYEPTVSFEEGLEETAKYL